MKSIIRVILLISCIFSVAQYSHSARILVIIPVPSYSHQIPYHALWKALIQRGHEIVLVASHSVPGVNSTKLTHIDLSKIYTEDNGIRLITFKYQNLRWLQIQASIINVAVNHATNKILNYSDVRKLYHVDSNEKFDVVMAEFQYTPAMFALAHRFDAPLIGITTIGLSSDHAYMIGEPILPSHPSNWELEDAVGGNLSFSQRIFNFINLWYHLYLQLNHYVPQQQMIAEKYLGKGLPSLIDMARNVSVIFCNQDVLISYARPSIPKIIPFTYIPTAKKSSPLPNELQNLLDNATDGFIYFSFGTNVLSTDLPESTTRLICDVFSKMPYKVLWKYDNELPEKTVNIITAKWFPQQTILAHPNAKLLIYQGGMQTTQEAINNGVPVVGIPITADQTLILNKLRSIGVGKVLNLLDFSKSNFEQAIKEVITDKRYKERMINLKNLLQDKPYDQIKNLVWWTEFVIRNRGAPHLAMSVAEEPWYQRYDVDVVGFLVIIAFTVTIISLLATLKCLIILLKYCKKTTPNQKEKMG